jgi:hypothetical protein
MIVNGNSFHAASNYRNAERYDDALLHQSFAANFETPWCCIRELFIFECENVHCTNWALVQLYKYVDRAKVVHPVTMAPYVTFGVTESFAVVPAAALWQLIHVIPNSVDVEDNAFWINWFVNFGPASYPEAHRFELQQKFVFASQ